MAFVQCPTCGVHFISEKGQKHCSKKCKVIAQNNNTGSYSKVCRRPQCGKAFTANVKTTKYCSEKCKRRHEHEKYLAKRYTEEKTCARQGCDVVFKGTKKRKYCCQACADIAKRWRDYARYQP